MNLSDKKISMSFSIDFPAKKITVIAEIIIMKVLLLIKINY
jgi:hypothetical protein